MPLYRLPLPQIFIAILIGIVLVDLKFDYNPNKIYPQHYYSGHSSYIFPCLEANILLIAISSLYTVIKYPNFWNVISMVYLVATAAIYIVFQLPLNTSITLDKSVEEQSKAFKNIQFWHTVIMSLLVQSIFTFFAGGQIEDKNTTQKTPKQKTN